MFKPFGEGVFAASWRSVAETAADYTLAMPHLVIAAVASAAVMVIAIFARDLSYRFAPVFLLPAVWGLYHLRQPLNLRPLHHAMIVSAILMHMMGAFGWYQSWPGPFSFDILVHFWFALVVTLAVQRLLVGGWPLHPWQSMVLSFFISMGLSALHEIMEYGSYLLLGEERGMLRPSTSYILDTQRDLTNNLLGTLTALAAVAIARMRHTPSPGTPGEGLGEGNFARPSAIENTKSRSS